MERKEKIILVTGSSRGIGRGIALSLAAEGFSVAVNYAGNREAAEETVSLCREASVGTKQHFAAFQGDIGKNSDRAALIDAVYGHFGDCHGLVNNAGVAPLERRDLLQMSEESFDRMVSVNLKGSFFLSQEIAKRWVDLSVEKREGRILVFITSVSAEIPSLNRGEYCIAKAGLSMGVKLFARRLAADGIGVFEVRPGIILTDMTGPVTEKYNKFIEEGLVPQKRWGYPDDIGRTVAVMVNGGLGFSTGSVVNVDGGMHIPLL